ncbi:MAG: hypothetical protein K8R88_05140 [Armatimonadetes bacterium]|nr:hypothetical protein [Armatimonadota bacterium]
MKCFYSFVVLSSLIGVGQSATFNFENLTPSYTGAGSRPGFYQSVSQTDSGVTLTVTRTQNTTFDVFGMTSNDGIGGHRWLDGFNVAPERPFVLDFSQPLSDFSLFIGQFTASGSRNATLKAYSGAGGTGVLLGEVSGEIPMFLSGVSSSLTGVQLTVAASGIRSVTATANSPFNNAFIDNGLGTVLVTPEPVSAISLLAGLLLCRGRRK